MSFEEKLQQHYPGSFTEVDFVRKSADLLAGLGFHRDNSIACVGSCRDEISQTLQEAATEAWGLVFDKSSLAGLPTAGNTGMGAALAHAPQTESPERYVFYAMPHVAIGPNGEAGVVPRVGRPAPSTACGALLALHAEIESGNVDTTFQMEDIEQSLLRARIAPRLEEGAKPDLFELTDIVHDAILEELERTIGVTVDTEVADYAIFTGIQIHTPQGTNLVFPKSAYACLKGERQELELTQTVEEAHT